MAIYSVANRTTGTGAGAANLEIISSATIGYRLLELGFTLNAATATAVALGAPAAKGVTPTSPVTLLAEDAGNTTAGSTQTALAWGTGPTVPVTFYRRASLSNVVGSGMILTFPRGLIVLKNTNLVFWNITTVSAMDVWVVVDA
jgi:hypothetical protein